ncbi:hypothetical protein, partial [Aeromonas veronii]
MKLIGLGYSQKMVEITGYLALSRQVKTKRWRFNALKIQKPGREAGLCVGSGVQPSGSVGKNAHSKKAFPSGKAFKLVAERTGLEPATPGVTG